MRWRYYDKPWWEMYPNYMFHFRRGKGRKADYAPPEPVFGLRPSSEVLYNHVGKIDGDLYIGSGAGKHMLADLQNARKSIKIISPYLSDGLLDILFRKRASGCDVSIITLQGSPSPGDPIGQKKLILNAVSQIPHPNEDLLARKKKWFSITLGLMIIFGIIFFLFAFFLLINESIVQMAVVCMGLSLFGFFSCFFLKDYIRKIRVNYYSYDPIIPFKIFSSRPEYRLHQKIYIIDDEMAYIGSLNFTYSGCNNNLETSMKIENLDVVENLSQYFCKLLFENNLPYLSPNSFGGLYFWEDYYGTQL